MELGKENQIRETPLIPSGSGCCRVLNTAQALEDMDIPGFRLHPLKGEIRGRWAITVSGNWRLTFEFQDGNAYVLDYKDYR